MKAINAQHLIDELEKLQAELKEKNNENPAQQRTIKTLFGNGSAGINQDSKN